jgi:hypothetical protein
LENAGDAFPRPAPRRRPRPADLSVSTPSRRLSAPEAAVRSLQSGRGAQLPARRAGPPGEKRAALELTSRARTSAFVSTNIGRYEAFAATVLLSDFSPLRYREDVDEGPVHRAIKLDFPPADGTLAVAATKNGEPEPFTVQAGSDVRDILSTLFLLRAQPLKPGAPVCVEVYVGRKVWKLQGQVAGKESIDTPLGQFATVRIDADAVLVEDRKVKRAAHVWFSDDERRLPLVAVGEVKGKVLRAQLVEVIGNGRRLAQEARKH